MNSFLCIYGKWEDREAGPDFLELTKAVNRFWFHEYCRYPHAVDGVKKGDLILLQNYQLIVAWGYAAQDYSCDDCVLPEGCDGGWRYSVRVDKWHFYNNHNLSDGVHHYGVSWNTLEGGQMSVVKKVDTKWALNKLKDFPESLVEVSHHTQLSETRFDSCKSDMADLESTCALGDSIYEKGVGIATATIGEVLREKLVVPAYQRGFCWKAENVLGLLNDIVRWQTHNHNANGGYRVGTIILKARQGGFEIIDGQQRITTLALLANVQKPDFKVNLSFERSISVSRSRYYIRQAANSIDSFPSLSRERIDFEKVNVGVIVIGSGEPDDLSFLFFNHINSFGKRLADYDLLKSHHLRYINQDNVARKMAERWSILEQSGTKADLLHKTLFRIRRWLQGGCFSPDADEVENRELFHEFSMDFDPINGLITSYKEANVASILSGGLEFFNYIDKYRKAYNEFCKLQEVQQIDVLKWESYGTLFEGIKALAFMFYSKFGDVYLREAIYAIAYRVSEIRNETRVQRDYISRRDVFSEIAKLLSRVTHEGEFLGKLLDQNEVYRIENKGRTALRYWDKLSRMLAELVSEETAGIPTVFHGQIRKEIS